MCTAYKIYAMVAEKRLREDRKVTIITRDASGI